jgi:sister chromatid cohesion protein PDS5
MARRRAAPKKPVEVEDVEEVEHEQEEQEQEQAQEQEHEDLDMADAANDEPEGDLAALQFDQELSWRPTKPIATATLLKRLEALSKELADFDQGAVELDSLKDVAASLAHRNLLQHKDRGVKAYTACCLVDVLRLFVPDAPYTDDQLKVRRLWQMIQSITDIPLDHVLVLHQRYPPRSIRSIESVHQPT